MHIVHDSPKRSIDKIDIAYEIVCIPTFVVQRSKWYRTESLLLPREFKSISERASATSRNMIIMRLFRFTFSVFYQIYIMLSSFLYFPLSVGCLFRSQRSPRFVLCISFHFILPFNAYFCSRAIRGVWFIETIVAVHTSSYFVLRRIVQMFMSRIFSPIKIHFIFSILFSGAKCAYETL